MQVVHRETTNPSDPQRVLLRADPVVAYAERAVIDLAREYYRTGGQDHHELMDAVQWLEQAYLNAASQPTACFCGTGREHERGAGYHCRKLAEHAEPRTAAGHPAHTPGDSQ